MTTFNKFAELGPVQFAEAVRSRGNLWVFQHIPKTAGSTLTGELRFCLPPYYNIHVRHAEGQTDRLAAFSDAVDTFVHEHRRRNFRSCSGHLRRPTLQRLVQSIPQSRVITFLRDPVSRFISEFRYRQTDKHPNSAEDRARYPEFEAFLADPEKHNRMWKFVAQASQEVNEDNVRAVFNRYAFIGLVEELETDFAYFAGLSGYPKSPARRANQTVSTQTNFVEETPELRERIAEANAKDMAFYAAVKDVLSKHRPQMKSYISELGQRFRSEEPAATEREAAQG